MSIVMNQSKLWQDIVGIVIMKMTINKGLENAMQITEIMSNISADPNLTNNNIDRGCRISIKNANAREHTQVCVK